MTEAKPPTLKEQRSVQTLTQALRRLDHAGIVTPCAGRDEWISDDKDDVETAKLGCSHCPIIEPCRIAGRGAYAGVWGGQVHRKAVSTADSRTDDSDTLTDERATA